MAEVRQYPSLGETLLGLAELHSTVLRMLLAETQDGSRDEPEPRLPGWVQALETKTGPSKRRVPAEGPAHKIHPALAR